MHIKVCSNIFEQQPDLQFHVLLISNIENSRKSSNVTQLLRGTGVVTKNELKKGNLKELLQELTEKSEKGDQILLETYLLNARLKKIQLSKELEQPDNLQNIISYLSLKHLLPIFAQDLDQAERDLLICYYQPKKGKKAPEMDISRDTKITALWFPDLLGMTPEQVDSIIQEIDFSIQKYCHGEIANLFTLNKDNRDINLGYQSEKELEFQNSIAQMDDHVATDMPATQPQHSSDLELEFNQYSQKTSIKDYLKRKLIDAVNQVIKQSEKHFSLEEMTEIVKQIDIEEPRDLNHGDYASSVALKLTKQLELNPHQLAQQITAHIKIEEPIKNLEIITPGFINFRLSLRHFQEKMEKILHYRDLYGQIDLGHRDQIMIELGSLNVAKPFGVHHFFGTIIGQTLINLHRAAGFEVLAADYPGDWGTQFGKLIYAIREWGDNANIEKDPINELLKLYVKFHDQAESKPELEDLARAEFKKLEDHDAENIKLWKWISELSYKQHDKMYRTLGVVHDRKYPESKYLDVNKEIVQLGLEKGIFKEGENGAIIADLEQFGLGTCVIQKADGASLYITRDLASIRDRITSEPQLKKLIYVIDIAQQLHVKQLFHLANQLGFVNGQELIHVAHGRLGFKDMTMSTRKGNIMQAEEVIQESLSRSEAIINDKSPDLSENEKKQVIQGVAIGAVKFGIISQSPETNVVFDWEKILNFEGNSAPYLQYTQARANSILHKAAEKSLQYDDEQTTLFSLEEDQRALEEIGMHPFDKPIEQKLLKLLTKLPEKVELSISNLKPNQLTNYLIEVAQTFNTFYQSVQVLRTQKENLRHSRLQLVEATAQILKNGLNMIGISTFERM